MVEQSSGTYIINKDYDIVTFNQTALDLYPSLKKGEKCYKCLMNLDTPCPPCPVANRIKGPKTYFDPIRKIYETVDAVPVLAEDGSENYALVFSTVGEKERYAKQLPNTESEFNALYDQEYYDKLTGGFSKKGFIRKVEAILKDAAPKDNFVLTYYNIQNFKSINGIFGFAAGDVLLCQEYLEIEQNSKPLALSRIHNDIFVCFYKQKDFNPAQLTEYSIHTWSYNGKTMPIHILHGIYYVEDKSMSVSGMIDRAALASNHIVNAYVKPYAIFDEVMRKEYIDHSQILFEYAQAIEHGEIEVYYQPIVDTITQTVVAAEALVRWNHPEHGFIRPDIFVPVLEKHGHITQLDQYVLEMVSQKLLERSQKNQIIVPVAINLSWMDLYDEKMRYAILQKINHSSVLKKHLRFETTETAFNTMENLCKDYLDEIRKSGCKIVLDDFGSGYSSFSMIQNFRFDILKLDMGFIKKIELNLDTRSIVRAIIAMCHEMSIQVVAEGVETETEYEFLQVHGCDYIQGYYFARPMPEADFYQYLEEQKKSIKKRETYLHLFSEEEQKKPIATSEKEQDLLAAILDRTEYFIQVCEPDTMEIVYANQATRAISGKPDESYVGQKCYQYMMGADKMCAHCPMWLMHGENRRQLEVDDGNYIFSLTAQYFNWNGKRYFMEMGRDVTKQKMMERKYDSQILAILKSMPEKQGVFHMNVTLDECLSSTGMAQNARNLQNIQSVDTLIRQISLFVPDKEKQENFFKTFCRDALLKAHEEGKREISLETLSYYDDKSIRWSRITVHLLENPKTKHLEAVLYGMDISKEKENDNQMNLVKQELQTMTDKYNQADYESRRDFLTGLLNRKSLFDYLKNALADKAIHPTTMYMIDVDNFKKYNDTNGHEAGDECLRKISYALKEYGKEQNICFFRYGGEEILGISEGAKELAAHQALEMLNTIRNLCIGRNDSFDNVTVSIGYTTDNSRYEKMIDKADQAMYFAKSNGKNQVVCYEKL
ncbi:EAL domain-containing protein [Ventrimonas sp. CLA-AP-H27]|uniref:EAL domain-containing protein n=1 Tax=Ventrimonas faecis TaxID=3133170 RepID=A0ABV1HMD5_9FIRM